MQNYNPQQLLDTYFSFGNLELLASQVVEGFITGLHKSPYHGFSVEFAEHRIYNSGESTKNIDWKLFARTDKLFVKRFEEETNLRCFIAIDSSSSMYYPYLEQKKINKFLFSSLCTAALTQLLYKQRDAVGLYLYNDNIQKIIPAKSTSLHRKLMFSELENLIKVTNPLLKQSNTAKSLHYIAENVNKRSLIILFTDFIAETDNNELFNALQHLKYNKHEVIVFQVTDKSTEVDFNFENRPLKFIDMESGTEVKLHPQEIKRLYIDKMAENIAALKLKCTQFHIDFVEADISEGFYHVLQTYLVKRSKMF